MKIALMALCVGAVAFLLAVLVSLLREWMTWPKCATGQTLAKADAWGRRRKVVMISAGTEKDGFSEKTGNWSSWTA